MGRSCGRARGRGARALRPHSWDPPPSAPCENARSPCDTRAERSVTAHSSPRSPQMEPKPWYEKGLRFDCQRCGQCCTAHGDYAYVYLAEADVQALATQLELDRETFLERHCRWEDGWIVLRMDGPACPFLAEDRTCRVYAARPQQCRTWPFWRENLRREVWEGPVRECCPGIDQGTLHPREEVERIADENEAWYEA